MTKPRKVLTRDEAKAVDRFEIVVDDYTFECRTPGTVEFMAAGILPPAFTDAGAPPEKLALGRKRQAEELERKMAADVPTMDLYLSLVLANPALWMGPAETCPAKGFVARENLGPFRDGLLQQILPRVGYGGLRRKAVDFRDPKEAGGAAAAPGAEHEPEPAGAA